MKNPFSALFRARDKPKDSVSTAPEDIAVCGFDDIELSSLISPSLTTVRQPRNLIGRRSMEKMLGCITGKDKNLTEQIVLDYEIVIRQSSGKYKRRSI